MKREIKFRAWDGKTMSYQQENGWFLPNIDTKTHKNQTVRLGSVIGDETLIPMQYTGLKDKNGVEIYECDIIQHPYRDYEHPIKYVVKFENGAFGIDKDEIELGMKYTEVIGNIYENPELL